MPTLYTSDTTPEELIPQVKKASTSQTSSDVDPGKVKIETTEPHIMTSFHQNPEGISFANQAEDEHVILFLRRHYITNISWQVATLVFLILPLLGFTLITFFNLSISLPIPSAYLIVLTVFYYLIVIGYAFISFVVWFYNVGIVSNKRVIDIDINGISSKDVAAADVGDIIDVSYKQSGFQQNIFDFGDVFMETEATKPNFEFLNVPHPAQVTDLISTLAGKERR